MSSKGESPVLFLRHEDDLVLFLSGSVTANDSYAMYNRLEESLTTGKVATLYLDFYNATYIDSTTVGTLIKLKRLQERGGRRLILANLSEPVREILEKMKLISYFDVAASDPIRDMERRLLGEISEDEEKKVTSQFILDAHHDIVALVPELREEFETLFRALEQSNGE